MSNSVVKVIEPDLAESLTLIVGADGIITPNKETVTAILSARPTTDLNIMHMNKAEGSKLDVTIDTLMYIHSDEIEDVDYDMDEVSRNLKSFHLDHDYLRGQHQPEEEDLDLEDELTQTLRILDGDMPEDEVEQKMSKIANKKEKELLTKTLENVPSTSKIKAKMITSNQKLPLRIVQQPPQTAVTKQPLETPEETKTPPTDDAEEELDDEELEEDEETSEDEPDSSDDGNDSDFRLDDSSKGQQQPPKRLTRRAEKPPKVLKPVKVQKVRVLKKPQQAVKQQTVVAVLPVVEKLVKEKEVEEEVKPVLLESISRIVDKKSLPPKKEKKPPKPIPDDFALFSTPDIIRRVGKDQQPPTTPDLPKSPTKPARISPEHRSRTTSTESRLPTHPTTPTSTKHLKRHSIDAKSEPQHPLNNLLPVQMQPTAASTSNRRPSVDSLPTKREIVALMQSEKLLVPPPFVALSDDQQVSVQEFETNSSSESLIDTNLEPLPSAEDIRAIIQSDATKTFTTYSDSANSLTSPNTTLNTSTTTPNTTHTTPQITVDGATLDLDQTLLDNIGNDLISDDILYQVAQQLVDNTELQNAIDKSIKEGVLDTSGIPGIEQQHTDSQSMMLQTNQAVEQMMPVNQQIHLTEMEAPAVPSTQIVRPDGRVIIIPPIERPTTRSRKRQETPNPVIKTITPMKPLAGGKKPLDNDHVSGNELDSSGDESGTRAATAAAIAAADANDVDFDEAEDDDDDEDESEDDPNKLWCICNQPHNNRFMICCDTCEEWYHGKCVNVTKAMGQMMEQQGKDWICLYCKDLSLTRPKAAARRIRKASRTSTDSLTAPTAITPSPINAPTKTMKTGSAVATSTPTRATLHTAAGHPARIPQKARISGATNCVVCGKPSRNSSIYCSDVCILKHAQGVEKAVVYDRKTGKLLSGASAPSVANLEKWLHDHPSYEVVRTAKRHPQNAQMTQSKLKLVRNDGRPGVSLAVQRKGVNIGVLKHVPRNPQLQVEHGPKTMKNTGMKILNRSLSPVKSVKLIAASPLQPKLTSMPNKGKVIQSKLQLVPINRAQQQQQLQKTPGGSNTSGDGSASSTPTTPTSDKAQRSSGVGMFIKDKPVKDKKVMPSTTPKARLAQVALQPKQDNIREGIRKSLLEQLQNRLKLVEDIKLNDDEVLKISEEIESQLYKCFGDTGQKYRNKYRSLIFNIKDLKNQTLWRKICEKAINPYQLVRLSPDDLASQELALWRERETKHQLDMIKKSEMELLNCNRQYVFKTHKGEQVFEDETPKEKMAEVITDLGADSTENEKRDRDKKNLKSKRDRDRSRDRGRSREDKTNKSDRRTSSRSRKKRSKSRERSTHERKRSRSRDRHREKDRRSNHKSSRHKKDVDANKLDKKSTELLEQLVDKHILKPFEDKLWKHVPQEDIVPTPSIESDSDHEPTSTVTIPTPPRSFDTEDNNQTAVANVTAAPTPPPPTATLDDAPYSPTKTSPSPNTSPPVEFIPTPIPVPNPPPPTTTTSNDEPPLWRGSINMADVAQISITAHPVSGDCHRLGTELPPTLEIVGRISPDTVWDYIGKMRSSSGKVISVLRLTATNVEEKMPYIALYSYLSSRGRLGVVKVMNKVVKDFYILPLPSHMPIPQALLPLSGPGFEESRPPLLLGIVIRDKRKRPNTDSSSTPSTKRVKVDVVITTNATASAGTVARSYTPPPTRDPRKKGAAKKAAGSALPPPPVVAGKGEDVEEEEDEEKDEDKEEEEVKGDEDEPYSPEDSDPDSLMMPTDSTRLNSSDISSMLTGGIKVSSFLDSAMNSSQVYDPFSSKFDSIPGLEDSSLPASSLELQRKMAELDQRIAMQKAEIDNMSHDIVSTATTDIGTSVLANIALPSNLQQILENIKTIGGTAKDSLLETAPSSDLTIPLLLPKLNSRHSSSPLPISDHIPLNLPNKPLRSNPISTPPKPVPSPYTTTDSTSSVLSSLTEEELIRKAAEMLGETTTSSSTVVKKQQQSMKVPEPVPPPPPPIIHSFSVPPPGFMATPPASSKAASVANVAKRMKIEIAQPPIPGLEDEIL